MLQFITPRRMLFTLAVAACAFVPSRAGADKVFDFETADQLQSPVVSGDLQNFVYTTEQGHSGSATALKFDDPAVEPYESFTYDVPFDAFTSGVISVWFYDTRGGWNTGHGAAKSGGAIILEDKDNPQDFVAVEALSYPYGQGGVGSPAYYASEGSIDRLKPDDRFDISNLPLRAIGFHKVEFHVSDSQTLVYVDGQQSLEVAGPGASSKLRLRFMADSPSNGGQSDWVTSPKQTTAWAGGEWLYFDDITFSRELPAPAVATQDFEITNELPEYDVAGASANPGGPGVPPNDNPYMNGFVNQWDVTTSATAAHSGSQSAHFVNNVPILRSITFDLAEATPGTSATLYFYDALGQNQDFDKDNSIIIENGNDPGEFIAIEISNWPYPYGGSQKNYYLTEATGGSSSLTSFYSLSLPPRSIGWHKVEIGFYPDHTRVALDDTLALRNGSAGITNEIARGPGLDKTPRLRLLADGASQGGFGNWTRVTPLTASYRVSTSPYVYYDDITLPIPSNASVENWTLY